MKNNIAFKAVLIVTMLSLLCGLFGCGKARHKISDITSVSLSCGHMTAGFGYSFWIRKEGDDWLFDAECYTHDGTEKTVFENREVGEAEINSLLGIIEKNNLAAYAENYKKPKDSPIQVMDETAYIFVLGFSDKSRFVTNDRVGELEEYFYRLAEQ